MSIQTIQDPETVSAIAARLMRGHDVRLARLGVLRSSWTPARKDDGQLEPPHVDVVLDSKPGLAESEPPSSVDFLSRRIQEALSGMPEVAVDGLGTFRLQDTETLFEPENRLRISVNALWGHLEAHGLPTEPVFAAPEEPAQDVPVAPVFTAPPAQPATPDGPDTPAEPVTPVGPDTPAEPVAPDAPHTPAEPVAPVSPAPPQKPVVPDASPTPPKRKTPPRRRPEKKLAPSRPPVWLLVAGGLVPVLIVLLAVLLWPDSTNTSTVPDEPAIADNTSATEADSTDASATTSAAETTGTADTTGTAGTAQPAAPTEIASADPVTPSGQLTRGLPGYTLILASGIGTTSANALAKTFEDLGLPHGLLTYPTENGTLNRLALGQWPTVGEADSMRTVLADRLPDGTWVKRLD